MNNMRTLKICKTCMHAEKEGWGLACKLTGKKCLIHCSQVDEDCVNAKTEKG